MPELNQSPSETITHSIQAYYVNFLALLPRIALGIFIVVAGILIAHVITEMYRRRILKQAEDPLMAYFLARAIKTVLTVITILLALQVAGLSGIAAGLLTAAGGAAIVFGFAFQDIGKNFLAGIILAFNRPFNIDDTVMIDGIFGKVKELRFRYSHIKTFDGRDIYIPNSDVLTKPVENYTADGFYRVDFVVGVGYEDDIEAAKRVIQTILDESEDIIRDDEHENFVIEDELAASTVNLKVFFWVDTKDYRRASLVLRGLIIRKVKKALADQGYNLPADIKELKIYGTEDAIPIKFRNQPEQSKPKTNEITKEIE